MKRELRMGDRFALLAPASAVAAEYCFVAQDWLLNKGFQVKRYPSAHSGDDTGCGSYSAPREVRIAEMRDALSDPTIDAILCARGGYGCIHLLEEITPLYREHPKWIIGFSDVSALISMAVLNGGLAIHSPMAKHLTEHPTDLASRMLLRTLKTGEQQPIEFVPGPGSITGECEGKLIGGNLAVLNSLADTPWDIFQLIGREDCILFIEDISEAIYAVERMLYRLHLSGKLAKLKGLLIGRFTEYKPDRNYPDMESMIRARLQEWGEEIPVGFDFPVGHVDDNMPLVCGSRVRLECRGATATLKACSEAPR